MVYPVTPDEFRAHQSTPLGDDPLGLLLDAAQADIDARIGPAADSVEYHRPAGPLLGLVKPAASVSEVIENEFELDPDDYELRPSGSLLVRLTTGPNPSLRWRGLVKVTSSPVDDSAVRARVQIGLVKLELDYTPGVASETLGSSTTSSSQQQGVTYRQLRDEYLESLEPVGILR